jgi:mono/diheme cytochrome c family protein
MRFESVAALASLLLAVRVPAYAESLSESDYGARCQMCHQNNGKGLPGQFPRLTGRVDKMAATPPGRRYLILVVLHGMAGDIVVDGQQIIGVMPSMAMLKDGKIASILNALSATEGKHPSPFTAAEVAKIRGQGPMSGSQNAAERAKLAAAGVIP